MQRDLQYRLSIAGNQVVEQAFASLIGRVNSLEAATTQSTQATASLGQQFQEFRGGIEFAAAKIAVVVGMLNKLVDVAKAVASRFDEVGDITDNFAGNIAVVSERLGGMVRNLDAMRIANQAAQAGLVLTDDQLADVAVRAKEFADATGGDTVAAMEELTRALVTGREQGLEKFGITGRNTTEALAALHEQVGGAGMEGGLVDAFEVLNNRVDDATDAFIDAITHSEELGDALSLLGDDTGDIFGDMTEDARHFAFMLGFFVNEAVQSVQSQLRALGVAWQLISAGRFEDAVRVMQQSVALEQQRGASFIDRAGVGMAFDDARTRARQIGTAAVNRTRARTQRHRRGEGGDERESGNTPEQERSNAILNDVYERGNRDAAARRASREADEEKYSESVEGAQELARTQREQYQEKLDDMKELRRQHLEEEVAAWKEAAETIGGVLVDSFDQATSGAGNFFVAVGKGFQQELKGLAKSEFVKGMGALGEAALLWWSGVGAEQALQGAAFHFAAAAAAGAGSGGLSGIGGGGGRRGRSGDGGSGTRPERFDRAAGDSGGGKSVQVIMTGPTITAGTYREVAYEIQRVMERGTSGT